MGTPARLRDWLRRVPDAALSICIAALLLTACGGNGKASAPRPTAATAATTTTVDPQAAVLAAYRAFWDAFDKAVGTTGLPPNPDDPDLPAHMTGKELSQTKVYVISLRAKGFRSRRDGPIEFRPRVVSIAETTAVVDDCITTNDHVVDAKTGELRDVPGTVRRGFEAVLVLEAGTWKTSELHSRNDLCGS